MSLVKTLVIEKTNNLYKAEQTKHFNAAFNSQTPKISSKTS